MNKKLLDDFVQRAVQLRLMGFAKQEMRGILTEELAHAPSEEEWEEIEQGLKTSLRDFTLDTDETNEDLNLFLKRSEWIQQQLLSVLNSMLRNYNAQTEGRVEHVNPDGTVEPVLPVKPSDIATMGEKILKLDQDRLAARLSYPPSLQKAQQALAVNDADMIGGSSYAALTEQLWDSPDELDEPYDADFEAAQ